MGDDDALSMPNWGYYEPFKGNVNMGLQLNTRSFLPGGGRDPNFMVGATSGVFQPRDYPISDGSMPVNYNSWINHHHRDKFFNFSMVPPPSYNMNMNMLPEAPSGGQSMENLQLPMKSEEKPLAVRAEEPFVHKEVVQPKKSQGNKGGGGGGGRDGDGDGGGGAKVPRAKKPRKPKEAKNMAIVPLRLKAPRESSIVEVNGMTMDISSIPIPVCSCTGVSQQCYRWGVGGWQSACCTTNISTYPLPMSTKRRGARIAGRKMSIGAFKKVLAKLGGDGYNFGKPIDLKTHWARHGTNKFVTIK